MKVSPFSWIINLLISKIDAFGTKISLLFEIYSSNSEISENGQISLNSGRTPKIENSYSSVFKDKPHYFYG